MAIRYLSGINVDSNTLFVDDANNRVGIGTTNPGGRLHIATPDPATNFVAIDFRNPTYGIYGKSNSISGRGNTLEFTATDYNTNGSVVTREVLTLRPEGNVGIGTTSPAAKLDVSLGVNTDANQTISRFGANNASGQLKVLDVQYTGGATNLLTLRTNAVGTDPDIAFNVGATEIARFLGSGNVGIGTTAPGSKLQVLGDIGVGGGTYNGGVYANSSTTAIDLNWGFDFLYTVGQSNYSTRLKYYPVTGENRKGGIWNSRNNDWVLYGDSNNTPNVIIPSGNVGIGTTAPGVKLDIDGGFGGASVRVKGDQPAGAYYYGYMYDGTNLKGTTQTNIFYSGSTIAANTTIAEYAGLRIDAPIVSATGAVVTNNYGIYQSGSVQKNYFAGNVGIGTTAPGYKLDVSGTAYVSDDLLVGATNATSWHRISVATGGFIAQDGSRGIGAYIDSTAAEFFAYDYGVGSYIPLTIRTSTLNIANNGGSSIIYHDGTNVGINETAPSQKLHVSGNIRVTGAYYDSNNSAGSSGQVLSSTGSGTDWVSLSEITGVDGTGTANYIAKWSDTDTITNSQVFDNGTNVGINNASPKTKLDVNGAIGFGSKTLNISDTFVTVLTVNMSNHTGCYVKITAFGDWSGHSAVAYLGEFFLQNGASAYNEPGVIIRQVDNTNTDDIVAQIVDPAGTGTRDFEIQLKTTSASGVPFGAAIQYEVRGQYNSVS